MKQGTRVRVRSGEYRGMTGTVQRLWTIGSYQVRLDGGPNEDKVLNKWDIEELKEEDA